MTHLYARVGKEHPELNGNGKRSAKWDDPKHNAARPIPRICATEEEKDAYIRARREREGVCLTCGATPVGVFAPFVNGICRRCLAPKPGHNRRASDKGAT